MSLTPEQIANIQGQITRQTAEKIRNTNRINAILVLLGGTLTPEQRDDLMFEKYELTELNIQITQQLLDCEALLAAG